MDGSMGPMPALERVACCSCVHRPCGPCRPCRPFAFGAGHWRPPAQGRDCLL